MQPKSDSTQGADQGKDALYKGANFSTSESPANSTNGAGSPIAQPKPETAGNKIGSLNIDDNKLVAVAGDKPISDFSNLTVSNVGTNNSTKTPQNTSGSGKHHWYLVGGMAVLMIAMAGLLTYGTLKVLGSKHQSNVGVLSKLPSAKQISLSVPINGNQSVLFDQTNLKTINLNGDVTATGNVTALSFSGGGANLTNLNASNLTTGTVSNSRLSPQVTLLGNNIPLKNLQGNFVSTINGVVNNGGNIDIVGDSNINVTPNQANNSVQLSLAPTGNVTDQGNTFNGPNQLVQLDNTGALPALNAANLTNLNASNVSSGTLSDSRLSTDVTTQGNAFNGDSELVQLTNTGALPALNGGNLTGLNASNISLGTLSDSRLSTNVTLQGNTFNGADQLVQLNNSGALPALNGSLLTNLDASNITAGTLSDLRLEPDVTLQGNTFNNANQLVQLNGLGYYPSINGSLITNLNGANITTGPISNSVLNSDVALTDRANIFTLNNTFSGGITVDSIQPSSSLTVGSTSKTLTLQGNSNTSLISNQVVGPNTYTTTIGFTGTPTANVIYDFDATAAAGTYAVCTTAGNCSGQGGTLTSPGGNTNKIAKFTGQFAVGNSDITDDGSLITLGVSTLVQPASDSTSAFQVQNAAGTSNLFVADTTHNRIGIGTASPGYALDVNGDVNIGALDAYRIGGNIICTASGCNALSGSGAYIQNGIATQTSANFNIQSAAANDVGGIIEGAASQTADLLELQNSSNSVVANIDASGNINTVGQFEVNGSQIASSNLSDSSNIAKLNANQTFSGNNTFSGTNNYTGSSTFTGNFIDQNASDSTSAFQIQNHAGTSNLFVADTTDTRIGIGTATPGYTLDVNGNINISAGNQYLINGQAICGVQATCAPSSGSNFYIQNTTSLQSQANFNIQSTSAGSVVGVLEGDSGQTAHLLDLLDGSGFNVANFSNEGALSLGSHAGGQTGNIVFQGSGGAGTLTLQGPLTPNAGDYTLSIPAITGNANICTDNSVCAGYASSTGGNYIAKNAADTSTASFGGTLYQFSNTNTGAAGVLSLTNSGTSSDLSVIQTGTSEPSAGQALILANNNTTTPSGNLLDLQNKGTSKFSVDVNGNATAAGNLSLSAASPTISSTTTNSGLTINSNGTGTLALDSTGAGTVNVGTANATHVNVGNASAALAITGTNFTLATNGNITNNGTYNSNTFTSSQLTFQGAATVASGGSNTNLTVNSNGTGTLALDSTGAGTVNVGTTNATHVNIGNNSATVTVAGSNFKVDSSGNVTAGTYNTDTLGASALTFSGANPVISASTLNTGVTVNSNGTGTLALDSTGAGTVNVGTANATHVNVGNASAALAITGTNFTLATNGNITNNGTYNSNTFTSSQLTFQGAATVASGGSNTNLTVNSNGTGTLALDSTGAGTVNVGTSHATTVTVGNSGAATTVSGATIGIDTGTTGGRSITIGNTNATSVAIGNNSATVTVAGSNFSVVSNGNLTADGTTLTNTALTFAGSGSVGVTGTNASLNLKANGSGTVLVDSNGSTGTVTIASTAQTVNIGNNSSSNTINGTNTINGATTVDNTLTVNTSSATALLVENGSTALLTASTSGSTVVIGSTAGSNNVTVNAGATCNSTGTNNTSCGIVAAGNLRHVKSIILRPEYAGAVLDNGGASSDIGTMTAGYTSSGVGGLPENYYQWTTAQSGNETYDIVAQIAIPSDWAAWANSGTVTIDTKTSDTTNGTVVVTALGSNGSTDGNCSAVTLTHSGTSWNADSTHCSLGGSSATYAADGVMTLRLHLQAQNGGTTQVGNIKLQYYSAF